MAKKRDRERMQNGRRANITSEGGVSELRTSDQDGMTFARIDSVGTNEGELEAWDDDQKTAPDLFADASDEDQMQASGGHTQQLDEEPMGKDSPTIRRR
jgi:hypothetical protein